MNNRIEPCFNALRSNKKTALIPFITAGDPHPDLTVPLLQALVKSGADLLELGMPFSDPMADGPVIQRASNRALAQGVNLQDIFEIVRKFRTLDQKTPLILMGYLNPIERIGYEVFAQSAQDVGVDGILIVDLPPEESEELGQALNKRGLSLVYLLAPTSTPERIAQIGAVASGFVYYVASKGVTGTANLDFDSLNARIKMIQTMLPSLPVGVGFGIKDAASATRVAQVADAVIVGSAIVSRIEALLATPSQISSAIAEFLAELRYAIDN